MLEPHEQEKALAEFLARHVKPYDPATDDYERPPFAADIKEGKNDPIYNAHSYHTKVPPRSIIPYILHYTRPGDLILDPFCGSGMTGVAAQMCADPPADILESFPELADRVGPRFAILNDLSPAACHIAYNYNTPVDVEALKREFERIKAAVKDEFDWLYGTEHYEPAVGRYDPADSEVTARLKNPPAGGANHTLLGGEDRTWELITKDEVEARLGYPVTELPRDDKWGDLDVAKVKQWVCIPATIQYTIWSDVYRCEGFITIEEPTGKVSTRGKNAGKPMMKKHAVARGCGSDIVLWYAMANPDQDETESNNVLCPQCGQRWEKVDLPFVRITPIATDYTFGDRRGSQRRERRKITARESSRITEATPDRWQVWYPQQQIYPYRELMTMSANKRGVASTADFYTCRNLAALALLWRELNGIAGQSTRVFARFAFTGIIPYCCRKQNYGGGGGGMSGTLYLPSFHQEKNVWSVFERKVGKLVDEFSGRERLPSSAMVLKGSAARLLGVPDSSVDYVFADPPFGGNIFYADASILWESWLDDFTDERYEMVYHRRSKQQRRRDGYTFKTLEDYANDMAAAFKEMFRVLKPGRWATIEFNNSDGTVFEAIKDAVRKAGFEIVNMLLLDKAQKSFKQVKGATGDEDVVDKDVLFNLHKPAIVGTEVRTEDHDLEQQVADAVRQHLQTLPERIKTDPAKYNDDHRTTATINSMLMNALIPRGVSVERLNLPLIERVCARYFRKVGQRWYLRGEAVGNHVSGDLVEEEVAVKDEVTAIEWLRQRLNARAALVGELKPFWMRATGLLPAEVSQNLVLEDLLAENFWRDADTNRWREPTEDERERMNDDRSIRVLHDAERFVAGTLARRTTDTDRCEWIDVLFQACREVESNEGQALPALRGFSAADGHRLIGRLFQSILREKVPAAVFARAEKQTRVASQRIGQEVQAQEAEAKASRARKKGPTLFDQTGDQ
ncbi:MAG: DNA methyltransferase [Planctomycetota bacterium]|nr:DNA methyltransferase [Planctomycetota bacterium]